ncbi:15-hydroxyprostaglandin dehydrogenase [NAD(+)]-like [Photinus pyralis]|uniref:15-hydroxyprostaglandin dehydrogenase [NAD(+)]-like n=1 Tax=Photinus pyralis TaxID=7054 RepID=UPI001267738F|nr:15-hydroxyprostaglandin dehydrogenase [NAD(+)]-like [Photinus pyralis]
MYAVTGKVALITGGSRGIGAGIAREFLKAGLKGVTIVNINEEEGLNMVAELNNEFGQGKAAFFKTDVSVREEFDAALRRTVEVYNNLDIVVNNAVINGERDWERNIAVNLIDPINGTVLAHEKYLETYRSGEEAVIINVSSVAGLYPCAPLPIYATAKSGIIALTRSMGCSPHYTRTKIKVIAVCPGATDTLALTIVKFLGPAYSDLYDDLRKCTPPPQRVSSVSKGILQIIEEGESGSVPMGC